MKEAFLRKAEACKPRLQRKKIVAKGEYGEIKKGETKVFDLSNHFVGRLSMTLRLLDGVPDAPLYFRFTFAETVADLASTVDSTSLESALSGGWIQEEYAHVDHVSETLRLPRRYACRYIKVECLATSPSFTFAIDNITFTEETAATGKIARVGNTPTEKRIDEMALRTLRSCMQDVFEDGPKRDRRLWLGDLRLQALVNYETYKNYDLVKRCLYLFASAANVEGKLYGCVFTKPRVYGNIDAMFDYPLLFVPCLLEYLEATGDKETALELLPTALRQIELAEKVFDETGVVREDRELGWCFIDWDERLDRRPCAQAVYIYALKSAKGLCERLNADMGTLNLEIEQKSQAAIKAFYDEEEGLFVGENGQISYAGNAWFCLAEIFPKKKNAEILFRLEKRENALKPTTPYAYHYYAQALFDSGLTEKGFALINDYWGGMAATGADTFFECYDPENPDRSPYGDAAINSYCHAWSCTPAYFLRKYR